MKVKVKRTKLKPYGYRYQITVDEYSFNRTIAFPRKGLDKVINN